jgi:hypothetical protein
MCHGIHRDKMVEAMMIVCQGSKFTIEVSIVEFVTLLFRT